MSEMEGYDSTISPDDDAIISPAAKLRMDADIANRLPSESDAARKHDTDNDTTLTTLHTLPNSRRENETSQWQSTNP